MLLLKSGGGKQEEVGIAAACHISLLSMKNWVCNSTNTNTNTIENTNTNTNTNTITSTSTSTSTNTNTTKNMDKWIEYLPVQYAIINQTIHFF